MTMSELSFRGQESLHNPSQLTMLDPPFAIEAFGGISPVGMMENILALFHYNVGLPWWLSIVSVGIVVKALSLPFFIQAQKTAALSQYHKAKLSTWNEKIQNLYNKGQRAAYTSERQELAKWRTENGFPSAFMGFRNAAAIILISISAFLAVQHLCSNESLISVAAERLGWLVLSKPDPTLTLPLLSTILLMANIRLSFAFGANSAFATIPLGMKAFLYALTLGSIFFTKEMNSGLFLYFTTVNTLNIVQTLLLRVPFVRRQLKMIPLHLVNEKNLASPSLVAANKSASFANTLRQRMNAARYKKESQMWNAQNASPAPPKHIINLERLLVPTKEGFNFK